MKKFLSLALACLMAISLVACGSSDKDTDTTANVVENNNDNNPIKDVFKAATSSATGAYATITVDGKLELKEDAWLGLCPAGKDYIFEKDADEVDVIYFYADIREENNDPYVFSCDFSNVEDGTYALIVATSDDAAVGYVIIQLEMTKNGETLTFDYSNAKLNDMPDFNKVNTTDSENDETTGSDISIELNPVELLFFPKTSSDAGAYATIKLSENVELDDETAWLGLCPNDKDYITEAEADEVDVVFFYADMREENNDPYVFSCDFSDVEDGTYALVVTSSDDENVGYVVIQLEMTKNGDSISFDYSNAKHNDRPGK